MQTRFGSDIVVVEKRNVHPPAAYLAGSRIFVGSPVCLVELIEPVPDDGPKEAWFGVVVFTNDQLVMRSFQAIQSR